MAWDGYPEKKWLCYPIGFWIGLVAYLVATLISAKYLKERALDTGWLIAIGLIPMLPLLMFGHGLLRMIRNQDELYKRIQFEAIAYAFGITTFLTFAAGFLQEFEVIPKINLVWMGQILIVIWSIAAGLLNKRYG
jgi:hypothetical protein